MQAIVCDCPTQTMRKLPEIFENGAVPTQFTCVIHLFCLQHDGCSYLKIVACRSGCERVPLQTVASDSYKHTVSLSIHCINLQCVHLAHEMFLFKLQLTLRIHSFSQYTQY